MRKTLLTGLFLLAACTAAAVSAVITDSAIFASGLAGAAAEVEAVPGVSPQTLATVKTTIADINTVAAAIKTADSAAAQQSLVQQLETDFNTLIAATANTPGLPPDWTLGLQAAAVLLPVIGSEVNLVISQINPTPTAAPAASALALTPISARSVLAVLAAKR